MEILFKPIGIIYTPYSDNAPYQPIKNDKGLFKLVIFEEYTEGLEQLEEFDYIYVLYYFNKNFEGYKLKVNPPWKNYSENNIKDKSEGIGVFATRSPHRPNPIGLSIVKLKGIKKNIIYTTGIDAYNETPLLDIKPYIKELDSFNDSNYGWIKNEEDYSHLMLHIRGLPHNF